MTRSNAVSTPAAPATTLALATARMARRLTTPFGRGADTLDLRLLLASSSDAAVEPYDFADHVARFDVAPDPRYVLAATRDIDVDTTVTVTYEDPGADAPPTHVDVPAGTLAGTSFLLEQPVTATARVVLLRMDPTPLDNAPDQCWTLTALLGTTAKLLWVVGAERDQLRRHAVKTMAQRHLPSAAGLSLDLIGADLGVPRFPPLPYGFDPDTVALYHLGDAAGATPAVADLTAAYPGRTGHPGVLRGPVQVGLPGRYGQAMGFVTADAGIEVQTGTEFDIGEAGAATMECFVRPDPNPSTDDGPVLSRQSGDDGPGWAISVGKFGRGLARNVRFTISDGTHVVTLFADLSLPTDAFSHVAAVVDRSGSRRTSLYVDGVLRDWRFTGSLGAVSTTASLLIGASGGGFRGIVDEVRVSSVARAEFAPVLGEADEHYRRRLELFRRWTLPTPANLAAILNELVGPIAGLDPLVGRDPLIINDTDATLVRGTRLVHIRPAKLLPGESIDAAGRRRVAEATAVGTAAEEDTFDPAYLLRYDRTEVDFTPPPVSDLRPGQLAPDPHLVQVGVADRLDRLVALAGAGTGPPGRLLIDTAFDPRADDLRATGRAVRLGHSTVPPDRLAALAHRAGFDFVRNLAGSGTAQVYAAAAPGDYFAVELDPASAGHTDLDIGGANVALSLRPVPPPDAFVRWIVVPSANGRATLTPDGMPGGSQRTATLHATAAGELIVKADVTGGRHTVSATRRLRIGLTDLPPARTITADGTLDAPASVVDEPGTFFHSVFLARHDDPRVDYGAENHHLMQPTVAEALDTLLDELARRGVTGQLAVVDPDPTGDADPTGDLSATEGRRLVLHHPNLAPGVLAAVAFAAGFGHIQHDGANVVVRQRPGQLVMVRGPAGVDTGPVIEVDEGDRMDLTAVPVPAALSDAGPPAADPRLTWASGTFDEAGITLGSNTQPTNQLTAGPAGMAWVQASYLLGNGGPPYTFQVRLRPDLDNPTTVLSKDQHDLIMNILNVLHPIGVEVSTGAIRAHVIELRGNLQVANPDYTYPKFRVRGTLPRQVKGRIRG